MFRRFLVLSRGKKLRGGQRILCRRYLRTVSITSYSGDLIDRTKKVCLGIFSRMKPIVEKVIKDETGKVQEKYFVDHREVKNGSYIKYTPKGTPIEQCHYVNGQLHGQYVQYQEYEKLKHYSSNNNNPFGTLLSRLDVPIYGCDMVTTSLDRFPIVLCNYFHGQLHGRYEENQMGHIPFEVYGGRYRGWYKSYASAPRKKKICNYFYGQLHGLCEDYNLNDVLYSSCNYKHGKLHGLTTIYESYNASWGWITTAKNSSM